MITRETQEAMKAWLAKAPLPEQQLDWRWCERFNDMPEVDGFWWLNWAGPFTGEEQEQWNRLFKPPVDEATKNQLAPLLKQSRERELEAALLEQREPCLQYPAIEIDIVRQYITEYMQLDDEIEREEPNTIIRQLYHGAIEGSVQSFRRIEATHEGDTERFWMHSQLCFQPPTQDEMTYAFAWLRRIIQQGLGQPATADVSEQLLQFLRERLHLSFDLALSEDDLPVVSPQNLAETEQTISAEAARCFFEAVLRESGYEGWRAVIDYGGGGTRVQSDMHQVILSGESFSLGKIRHLLAHELAGHVARSFAGEHSLIGLLAFGTKGYEATEEGYAIYHERRMAALHDQSLDDVARMCGMLATGLASGVVTPPQTFSSLYVFFRLLMLLYRGLARPWEDTQTAQKRTHKIALERCLRTFRGVPDLQRAGVCYLQDAIYLRGILLLERVVAEDETTLEKLSVGKVAYDLLPLLEPLQMVPPPQPLRRLAFDPALDNYILSFESAQKGGEMIA